MRILKRAAIPLILAAVLLSTTSCAKRTQTVSSAVQSGNTAETDAQWAADSEILDTQETDDSRSQTASETDGTSIFSTDPASSLTISGTLPSSKSSSTAKTTTTTAANTAVKTSNGEAYGKYSGNVFNKGLITQVGDWIYYSNASDIGALYKIRSDGSGKTKLTSSYANNIQVCGDWVIFQNGNLKKIKTDGTNEQTVETDYVLYYTIVSDTIYYYTETPPIRLDWKKVDGSSSGSVDNFVCNRIRGMFPVNDWLYFVVYTQPPEAVRKVKADTFTGESLVSSSPTDKFGDTWEMVVQNDWVYYSVSSQSSIYRCKPDGSQNTKLLSTCHYGTFNTDGTNLYYISSGDGQLWKAGIDGSNPQRITNLDLSSCDTMECINITDQSVYVADDNNVGKLDRTLYRIDKSTLKQEIVS